MSPETPFETLLKKIPTPVIREHLLRLKDFYNFSDHDGIWPVMSLLLLDSEATRSHVAESAEYVKAITQELGPALVQNLRALHEGAKNDFIELSVQVAEQCRHEAENAVKESRELEKQAFWKEQREFIGAAVARQKKEYHESLASQKRMALAIGIFVGFCLFGVGFAAGLGILAIR